MNSVNMVENVAVNLLRLAVTKLPKDVKEALEYAYLNETSDAGKTQLRAILDNVELAEKTRTPMCQDTGTIIFYVKAGAEVRNLERIEEALHRATRRATWHISAIRKGIIPRNMVYIGTSGAIPLMINTFRPTGGVISPISITSTSTTPNHIGSNPSAKIMG